MKHIKKFENIINDDNEYKSKIFPNHYKKFEKILKKQQNNLNIEIGKFYKCIKNFHNFKKGEKYEVIDISKNKNYVFLRYINKYEHKVRFKMTIGTFLQSFSINNENKKSEIDSAFDDNWDIADKYIYSIGIGKDFDIIGYVIAEDEKSAIKNAIIKKIVNKVDIQFLKAIKLEYDNSTDEKSYMIELKKRLHEKNKAISIYNSLHRSFVKWKKLNK